MRACRSFLWESTLCITKKIRRRMSDSFLLRGMLIAYPIMERRNDIKNHGLNHSLVTSRLYAFCFFLLLLLFPFINLLSHPTIALWAIGGLLWGLGMFNFIRGIRTFRLIDLSVFLLLIAALLSCFGAAGGSRAIFSGLTVTLCISFYFLSGTICRSWIWKRRAAWSLCISGGFCGLCGVLQYWLTDLELRWVDTTRFSDIGGRVTVFFKNPNILAVFLLLCIPIMLFCILDQQANRKGRMLACVSFALSLLCLVVTWSRGAWLGILFSMLVFLILHGTHSNAFLIWMLPPTLGAIPFLPRSVRNRFGSIGSVAESSIRYRLYTWQGVCRMIREHPFGIGAGQESFSAIYPIYAVSGTERVMHAHNLLLRILCEWGIGGFLLFILFCGLLVLYTFSRLQDENRTLTLACFSSLCAVGVMGMFDDIWYHYGLCALFWIVCGILCAERREDICER